MKINLTADEAWNGNRLTLIEGNSATGDQILVCIHKEHDEPEHGQTVKVYRSTLIRAAKMLSVPYPGDEGD